jgi:hypothetical protein
MNQVEELQSIFLKWFKHHGIRSMQQIRLNIKNLCNSYGFERNGLYSIFFQLVRKGSIEFIGEDTYQIAPGVIIYDLNSGTSTGINLNDEQINDIRAYFDAIEIDNFGIVRFKSELKQTQNICIEIYCQFAYSNIDQVLTNFPRLSDVILKSDGIMSFEKSNTVSSFGFPYNLKKHHFKENSEKINLGIFKISSDAHVFYLKDGEDTYKIPSLTINPEGWCIAETYQAIKEGIKFLTYNVELKQLIIKNINIPILIERILRIPSLHQQDEVINTKCTTIYTNISPLAVKQLSRIFETKITTNHE